MAAPGEFSMAVDILVQGSPHAGADSDSGHRFLSLGLEGAESLASRDDATNPSVNGMVDQYRELSVSRRRSAQRHRRGSSRGGINPIPAPISRSTARTG